MNQDLLNEVEAAKILGWKVGTLRARRYLKHPPIYLKIGRKVYYRPDDLKKFLDECVRTPLKNN